MTTAGALAATLYISAALGISFHFIPARPAPLADRETIVSGPTRKRILFVDDETPILNLLQNLLQLDEPRWDCRFAGSGAQALNLIQERPFDVVVSDLRMPEMNGVELLSRVRDGWPRTARIILSGYVDVPLSIKSLSTVHQYLAKPFTLTSLHSTLDRFLAAAEQVPIPELRNALGDIHCLPSAPSVHDRFMREIASPAVSIDALGGLAAQDIALTARLLQLARSAFFGDPQTSLTAKECVLGLGPGLLRGIVASNRFLRRAAQPELGGLSIESLSRHGFATGLHACRILSLENAGSDAVRTAFTAGLLHRVGQLVLAFIQPENHASVMRRVRAGEAGLLEAEREAFGVTHPQVGAYLLALWGIPDDIVEIVAHAARPAAARHQAFGPLAAVHVASYLHRTETGLPDKAHSPLDLAWMESLRVDTARFDSWVRAGQTNG